MKQIVPKLMLTCEHASNRVPAAFKSCIPESFLKTHRAYDIGARFVFRKLVRFAKPEFFCEGKFSRLFVDLNRSITNKSVFSEFFEGNEKAKSMATAYWNEYRENVEAFVSRNVGKSRQTKSTAATENPKIVHLGIHSFTPELNGKKRNADIGILYDPAQPQECAYAQVIKDEILRLYPQMKVRLNYPYQGKSDGLTTALRQKFGPRYVGIEIEINQKFFA